MGGKQGQGGWSRVGGLSEVAWRRAGGLKIGQTYWLVLDDTTLVCPSPRVILLMKQVHMCLCYAT